MLEKERKKIPGREERLVRNRQETQTEIGEVLD